MKVAKDIVLMMMGAGAVLVYQKYSKPMMKTMEHMIECSKEKASQMLENM